MVSINNEAWYDAYDASERNREQARPIYANMTASNKSHYHFDTLKLISLYSYSSIQHRAFSIEVKTKNENQIKSKWKITMKLKILIFFVRTSPGGVRLT